MVINKIQIIQGVFKKIISFEDKFNLITSMNNSVGKTTLVRFILFGLGFMVTGTKGMPFTRNVSTTIYLTLNKKEVILERNLNYIIFKQDDIIESFKLPYDELELHSLLFNIHDKYTVENLLGCFYIDQDKGWTILNRGKVIGGIQFNIEKLISGLSESEDSKKAIIDIEKVSQEIWKYNKLFDISKYREQILFEVGEFKYDSGIDGIIDDKQKLEYEFATISSKISKLKKLVSENRKFISYIEKMMISIEIEEGNIVPVNSKNIVGYNDNSHILDSRIRILKARASKVKNDIDILNSAITSNTQLIHSEDILKSLDYDISKMKLDSIQIKSVLSNLKKTRRELKRYLEELIYYNNGITNRMSKNVNKYCEFLKIDKYLPKDKYLFTRELKSLSGTILSQMAFVYKLAYLKEIEIKHKLYLPIIIDSPRNNEITNDNAERMFKILKNDFSEHQVIISSVFKYDKQFEMYEIPIISNLMEQKTDL